MFLPPRLFLLEEGTAETRISRHGQHLHGVSDKLVIYWSHAAFASNGEGICRRACTILATDTTIPQSMNMCVRFHKARSKGTPRAWTGGMEIMSDLGCICS